MATVGSSSTNSDTEPLSGVVRPSSMSMVVDLPAPFGPSSATVSPAAIETSMPRTACTGPCGERNDLTSLCSWMPEAVAISLVVIVRTMPNAIAMPARITSET